MSKKRLAVILAVGLAAVGIAAAVIVPAAIKKHEEAKLLEEELAAGFNKNISVEIPVGRYYYNGDVSSDFYIEVFEDETIQIVNLPFDVIAENERVLSPELTDEDIQEIIDNISPEYFTPTKYEAIYFPDIDYTGILIFWNGSTGSGYRYADENVISWGMIDGHFVLSESMEPVTADSTSEEGTVKVGTPVAITFPAHQYAENSYNDELLDIEPFTLSVSLPEGWYTALPERSEYDDIDGLLVESSAVYIYDENGKQTGKVDYNTFDLEALAAQGVDITEKLPYRAVYSDIMLANHLTWDCDYTEVRTDGAVTSATCKVMMSALISGTGETEYFPAALAYNSELQVYVQFRFDEGSITDAELAALAYSVDISR